MNFQSDKSIRGPDTPRFSEFSGIFPTKRKLSSGYKIYEFFRVKNPYTCPVKTT